MTLRLIKTTTYFNIIYDIFFTILTWDYLRYVIEISVIMSALPAFTSTFAFLWVFWLVLVNTQVTGMFNVY